MLLRPHLTQTAACTTIKVCNHSHITSCCIRSISYNHIYWRYYNLSADRDVRLGDDPLMDAILRVATFDPDLVVSRSVNITFSN